MLNKDKRSFALCLVLGDGCLHLRSSAGKLYGAITIGHCLAQADYIAWKAQLLSELTGRNIKIRTGYRGGLQISVSWKRCTAWQKRFYPANRKNRIRMLPFIKHPELAMAVWLCDDGSSDKDGRLRLHTNAMTGDENHLLSQWFAKHANGITPKVKWQKKGPAIYAYLQFSAADTVTLYRIIREFAMRFKSMRWKFRRTEHRFQRVTTAPPTGRYGKDIVHISTT